MTESPEELAAVEQLLAEGDSLRDWLARLDAATRSAGRGARSCAARLPDQAGSDHGGPLCARRRDRRQARRRPPASTPSSRRVPPRRVRRSPKPNCGTSWASTTPSGSRANGRDTGAISNRSLSASTPSPNGSRGCRHPVAGRTRSARPRRRSGIVPVVEPPPPEVHVIGQVDAELVAIADLAPDAAPEDVLAIFDEPARAEPRRAPAARDRTVVVPSEREYRRTSAATGSARLAIPSVRERATARHPGSRCTASLCAPGRAGPPDGCRPCAASDSSRRRRGSVGRAGRTLRRGNCRRRAAPRSGRGAGRAHATVRRMRRDESPAGMVL